jgi:hypothetical protein
MEVFSISILFLAALFLWWVVKERGRNERERQVSVELVNRLFRLDERILKLEAAVEQQRTPPPPETEPAAILAAPRTPTSTPASIPRPDPAATVKNDRVVAGQSQPSKPEPTPARLLPKIEVDRDPLPPKAKRGRFQSAAYVNGRSLTGSGSQWPSMVVRNASLDRAVPDTPKLDELGMGALLCGIALLMNNQPETPPPEAQKI